MDIYFKTYGRSKMVKGITPDGAFLEWTDGCSGERHARSMTKFWLDDSGEVDFAEELAVVDQGFCDQSCGAKNGGFFSIRSNEPKKEQRSQL